MFARALSCRLGTQGAKKKQILTVCSACMSSGDGVQRVFDRRSKELQRDRAAAAPNAHEFEMIREEFAYRVCDRIYDIKRDFDLGIDVGCGRGLIAKVLEEESVKELVQCDLSLGMLEAFDADARDKHLRVQCDEEFLPFKSNTFDIAISNLSMHWVNDLPGTLKQIHTILKPDAPFIGAMFGGDTLFELRSSLQLAELERKGGFAPRLSPLVQMNDVGNLMQRAGFTLLTIDVDEVVVQFPSIFELMDDLRGMGESGAGITRQAHLGRDTIQAAAAIYQTMYGNDDGTIPATFQVVHMLGWKPDPSQPKPAPRGSANASLKDLSQVTGTDGVKTD